MKSLIFRTLAVTCIIFHFSTELNAQYTPLSNIDNICNNANKKETVYTRNKNLINEKIAEINDIVNSIIKINGGLTVAQNDYINKVINKFILEDLPQKDLSNSSTVSSIINWLNGEINIIHKWKNLSQGKTPINTSKGLSYKNIYQSSIIIPTWSNLINLLFSDIQTFRKIMADYNYSLATDGSGYIADTSIGSPYFIIQKSNKDITMYFSKDDSYISSFRQELKQILGKGEVHYSKDFEIYYITYTYNNFKYNIKIGLNENSHGS